MLGNFVIRIVFSKVFSLANTDNSQICVAVSKWAGTDSSRAVNQDETLPKIGRFQTLTGDRHSRNKEARLSTAGRRWTNSTSTSSTTTRSGPLGTAGWSTLNCSEKPDVLDFTRPVTPESPQILLNPNGFRLRFTPNRVGAQRTSLFGNRYR